MFFDVGQADAVLLLTPNGDAALIDTGQWRRDGHNIADYLTCPSCNGVGAVTTVGLLYSTHYDRDHIGGLPTLVDRGIRILKAFDQGPSGARLQATGKGYRVTYAKSLKAVGDPDGNNLQGTGERRFVRNRIDYGHIETIGQRQEVEILCVAVRGDTAGADHDLDRNPQGASKSFDENPGSIALLVRLGEFELYTAGDQTSNAWKRKPAAEEAVLASGAIPGGNDIDLLKVSHHGSDTSTGRQLARQMLPEVAIVSSKFKKGHGLPKRIVLKELQDNRSYVLITGDGLGPDGTYTDARKTDDDNAFIPSPDAVFNAAGDVTVLVSANGTRYTVTGKAFSETFSSLDADNAR